MEHIKTTIAEDELHEIALEQCDCGQFSLSVGPVTIQLEEDTVLALTRMLKGAVDATSDGDDDDEGSTGPVPSDVQ